MIPITEDYVNSLAPNAAAVSNGWGLVKKGSFVKLNVSDDETLIFGECKGSGASNYLTSGDFMDAVNPVFRCNCPSRQFPCKHALGLMLAYASGKAFEKAAIPEDIKEKRDKVAKKQKRKDEEKSEDSLEEKIAKPKKVNKAALQKKIQAQLEGLKILEKVIINTTKSGLGTINKKTVSLLEDQIKELGNYYITGAQVLLRDFVLIFQEKENMEDAYEEAMNSMVKLNVFCKKAIGYLEEKLKAPELKNGERLSMEELIGHAWQLSELKENSLVEYDAELVQLAFNSFVSHERKEFIDSGIWLNLKNGRIDETRNYRPFKAAKYIKEEDSFFCVAKLPELYTYPGNDMNLRIRWDGFSTRDLAEQDIEVIKQHAHKDYKDVIKLVKNQIKNPLSLKNPIMLLEVHKCGETYGQGEIHSSAYVIADEKGQRIMLKDDDNEPLTMKNIDILGSEKILGNLLLVRFHSDVEKGKLYAKPLSIVTKKEIIRLAY